MTDSDRYDVLVLGSGEAGKYLAWTMAGAGHRTAVVERQYIGGSCPNIACLPSKNIIHSARVKKLAMRGHEFGLETGALETDFKAVQQRKRTMVEGLVDVHVNRYKSAGVDLIIGEGRFVAPRTLEVQVEGEPSRRITGDRVFLNVGTRASIPDIPGLADALPLTHVEALDLEQLPAQLVVLGGGYIGLEFAQAMCRLGSGVTVIESGAQLAGREDPDIADAILEMLRDEGIRVMLDANVRRVSGRSGEGVRLHVEGAGGDDVVAGTHLLVAAGRTPNSLDIGADQAGIELDSRGYVRVNEQLETSAANVWAMGDCAGSPQFTHVAFDDFRIVRDNLLNEGRRTTAGRLVPYCMFTDPELGRVGLNEKEASEQGTEFRVARLPMSKVLRTKTTSEPRGFMKMLVAADSNRILGMSVLGSEATEIVATVQTAMLGNLPFTALRDAIFTHPTAAEGLTLLLADLQSIASQS